MSAASCIRWNVTRVLVMVLAVALYSTSVIYLQGGSTNIVDSSVPAVGLECTFPIYDFGEVAAGCDLTHIFMLKNTGKSLVKVVDVRSSCSCTAAAEGVIGKAVAPNEQLAILVRFDTKHVLGPVRKAVEVAFEGESDGTIELVISGSVLPKYSLSPKAINCGVLGSGSDIRELVVVRSAVSTPLSIERVYSDCSWVSVHVAVDSVNAATLCVSAMPPLPVGRHSCRVNVLTGDGMLVVPFVAIVE